MSNKKEHIRRTECGKEIESRIEKQETIIFRDRFQAIDHAKRTRSYSYPVYLDGKTNGQYAVPK